MECFLKKVTEIQRFKDLGFSNEASRDKVASIMVYDMLTKSDANDIL